MKIFQTVEVKSEILGRETECWRVNLLKPDGTLHSHVMPKLTLTARSIEYGINDPETLWDIVIHEPFMVHPLDEIYLSMHGPDPAVALGLVTPSGQGVTCHTAGTIADGAAAHLSRLAHCRDKIVRVNDFGNLRAPVLRHVEPWQVQAFIEDQFRVSRREARNASRN
jgi:hypothetical protein